MAASSVFPVSPAEVEPSSPSLSQLHSQRQLKTTREIWIRALLQALPTPADMEALIYRMGETHRRDLQSIRIDVQSLSDRICTGETTQTALEKRVSQLEKAQSLQASHVSSLQLHLEQLAVRSRRNNLRLRGIPEDAGQESLQSIVVTICQQLAISEAPQDLEFDRMHRALGPRSTDPKRPRDVICRMYHYSHRESILRKAWEVGDSDFKGSPIKILADLSRATLQRRALLRRYWIRSGRRGIHIDGGSPSP